MSISGEYESIDCFRSNDESLNEKTDVVEQSSQSKYTFRLLDTDSSSAKDSMCRLGEFLSIECFCSIDELLNEKTSKSHLMFFEEMTSIVI